MKWLLRFLRWLRGWRSPPAPPPPPPVAARSPEPPPEPQPAPRAIDPSGRFYFRGAVLDQLDLYIGHMKRLRRADHAAYQLHSRVGINLIPDNLGISMSDVDNTRIEPWFRETLPGAGGVCFATSKRMQDKEREGRFCYGPRFFYFRKFDRNALPTTVLQPTHGAVYVLTAFFDFDHHKHGAISAPVQMAVAILPDGTLQALKLKAPTKHVASRKNNSRRERSWTTHDWVTPPQMVNLAKKSKHSPEQLICRWFSLASTFHTTFNSSMIRVAASKDGVTAMMNVDMLRTPYFFKDRDPVIVDGVKKRIFHIVRPHERLLGNKAAQVHLHFRGLREFDWNGYHILITVPGRHHLNWIAAPMALHDTTNPNFDDKGEKGWMTEKQYGDLIVENIETGRPPLH